MALADVDWLEHDKAISAVVKGLNEHYLIGENKATPEQFAPVLRWLDALTRQLPRTTGAFDKFVENVTPQLQKDLGSWRARLAEYQRAAKEARAVDPRKHASADFGRRVVLPLLLGWYPGAQEQRPADVITPMSLAFQLKVKDAALREAWHGLMGDLASGIARTGGALLGIGLAGGALYLGAKLLLNKGRD